MPHTGNRIPEVVLVTFNIKAGDVGQELLIFVLLLGEDQRALAVILAVEAAAARVESKLERLLRRPRLLFPCPGGFTYRLAKSRLADRGLSERVEHTVTVDVHGGSPFRGDEPASLTTRGLRFRLVSHPASFVFP